METIERISTLITLINKLYNGFYKNRCTSWDYKINKSSCTEAMKNDFLIQVPNYIKSLETYKADVIMPECMSFAPYVRIRVKRYDTVAKKLKAKSIEEQFHGEYHIEKVINDLMGFRIILPEVNQRITDINNMLECYKQESIISRYYTRNDDKYRATHCYFKKDNRTLPWELQIWDVEDKKSNVRSHRRHEQKRSYILKRGGFVL